MNSTPQNKTAFAAAVYKWQAAHGRHNLPWQQSRTPYEVWLSEIMLQQTQVATVIPYYRNFLRRFPTLNALANAHQDSILSLWSGLGYYARARNLHKAAKQMRTNGIPQTADEWRALPGVGKSTAAAIMVFTQSARLAILDGNVKRVIVRTHAFPHPPNAAAETELWKLAENLLPTKKNIRAYTQGLMDLGATICRRSKPLCSECPLTAYCTAYQLGKTADYPVKVPLQTKPEKHQHMLLALTDNAVLLEKRQSHGIWGGLWSLPQAASKKHLADSAKLVLTNKPLLKFTHEFTHYRLHATVHICRLPKVQPIPPSRWITINKLGNLGLPAPIRKLLEAVTTHD